MPSCASKGRSGAVGLELELEPGRCVDGANGTSAVDVDMALEDAVLFVVLASASLVAAAVVAASAVAEGAATKLWTAASCAALARARAECTQCSTLRRCHTSVRWGSEVWHCTTCYDNDDDACGG